MLTTTYTLFLARELCSQKTTCVTFDVVVASDGFDNAMVDSGRGNDQAVLWKHLAKDIGFTFIDISCR